MKSRIALIAVFATGLVSGCNREAPSKIVTEVEQAGSGDLARASEDGIMGWLNSHTDVAKRIAPDCGAASKAATAGWRDTTEGKVCSADAKVLFFTPKEVYKSY